MLFYSDVTDGTVTGNQSYFTQYSIKYEPYSNKSVEKVKTLIIDITLYIVLFYH